jgi:LPS biosynthesis protein
MGEYLKEHQQAMLTLLKETDRICRKYHIQYQLFAGTALGAVRHQGFIPWDDDLDILLYRPEYEKFLQAASEELQPEFFLQSEFSAHWPMFYSKLRLNGTACIEKFIPRDREMHMGIYIDIFPCDNAYQSRLLQRLQFFASRIVISKCLDKRGYRTDSKMKRLALLTSRLFPAAPLRKFVQHRNGKECNQVNTFFACSSSFRKSILPKQWLTESENCSFEDAVFPVSKHFDDLLTKLYGDYRTLPPPEKRAVKEHAALVDPYNSYEIYLSQLDSMHFSGYTQSIR